MLTIFRRANFYCLKTQNIYLFCFLLYFPIFKDFLLLLPPVSTRYMETTKLLVGQRPKNTLAKQRRAAVSESVDKRMRRWEGGEKTIIHSNSHVFDWIFQIVRRKIFSFLIRLCSLSPTPECVFTVYILCIFIFRVLFFFSWRALAISTVSWHKRRCEKEISLS